jgi:hypothetical protein
MAVTTTMERRETMPPTKKKAFKAPVMTLKVLCRIKLGDNREIRIVRIPTGFGENLIRIGINTLPDGDNLSGATFPESYLPRVIDALRDAARA